jgi:hypothetical protein
MSLKEAMILTADNKTSAAQGISKKERDKVLKKYGFTPDDLDLVRQAIRNAKIVGPNECTKSTNSSKWLRRKV